MVTIQKIKNYFHLGAAAIANTYYRFPSRQLTVIGVTGTDGKTTTSNLIYHILRESGKKVAVISTIGAVIDGKSYNTGFHITTPSPFAIQKYIRLARQKGCEIIVLEVTSHALDQNRVWGVEFELGVLTNITHEHLDYHKNYRTYVDTKLKLFKKVRKGIVNSNGEWFLEAVKKIPRTKLLTYSLTGTHKGDTSISSLPFAIKTKLIGNFNLENILAAIVVCRTLGIDDANIQSAIESFEAPKGRQEEIKSNKGIKIIVDFAHTPNAFENILPEVRKSTMGNLIHVFGAAGERDSAKRPEMGKSASFYDDIIILTAEDPRSEKISHINYQIKQGISLDFDFVDRDSIKGKKSVYEIDDRKKAIEFALTLARKNDTVIITGKGHEQSINYGDGEEPWSDQDAVISFLKKHEI